MSKRGKGRGTRRSFLKAAGPGLDNLWAAISKSLSSPSPRMAVRALLVMEVLIFTAVLLGCIWLAPRKGEAIRWHHVALWALAAGLPVGLNLLHGDRPRDSGIRVDNLAASAREVAIATVVMAGGVLAVGIAAGEFYGRHWTRISYIKSSTSTIF